MTVPSGAFTVRARRGEIGSAVLVIALAVAILALSSRMPSGSFSAPGPAMFPIGLGIGLLLAGIGLLIHALRWRNGEDADLVIRVGHRHVWTGLAALTVLALIFEPLGYPLATALFMAALLKAYARLGWIAALLQGAFAALVSWYFFVHLLGVNLPLGILRGAS